MNRFGRNATNTLKNNCIMTSDKNTIMPPIIVFASIIKQTFRSLCQKSTKSRKMSASTNYHHILFKVFEKCVDSVKPKSLFNVNKCLQFVSPKIRVGNVSFGMYV